MKYALFALIAVVLISGCVQTTVNTDVNVNINNNNTNTTNETIVQPIEPVAESNVFNIEISNYKFDPAEVTIKNGTTVVWTNVDPTPHTVSSSLLSRTSGKMMLGESWNYTFDKTGTWNYYCAYHWEKGKITVE